MRSLTEIKGDDAFELIADMIEPATEIMSDKKVKEAYYTKNKASAVKVAFKGHKKALRLILALLNEVDVNTYNPSVADILKGTLQIIGDEALQNLFTLPNQKPGDDISGTVSESSKEKE